MGNSAILTSQLISHTKVSFMKKALMSLQWKYASFAHKQALIEEHITSIINTLESIDDTPQLGTIARNLLLHINKVTLPTEDDIHWLCDIVVTLQRESKCSIVSIESYYILLEFLRAIPKQSSNAKEEIEKACRHYTQYYPEALLIPADELKRLLTTTALYYPEMDVEHIMQGVCGIIKLAVRFAELANKQEEWEEALRKELCQIHSLNIHICLLLGDSELSYFLEESETQEPKDIVRVIIQQLTLEEVYRKHGEESTFFSKISALLSLLSDNIYYGKYSPIFTLYNYLEYCKEEYKALFALPLQYFVEIVTLIPDITSALSFAELSSGLRCAETVSLLFTEHNTLGPTMMRKQREILQQYASMTREELEEQRATIVQNTERTSIQPVCDAVPYEVYNVVFSYIDAILGNESIAYPPVPKVEQYNALIAQWHPIGTHMQALSLLVYVLEKNGLVLEASNKEHRDFIQKVAQQYTDVLNVEIPIFYAILTDIIQKEHTLHDIDTFLSYCSTVIDIAKQERLYTSMSIVQQEYSSDKGHSTTQSESTHASFFHGGYEYYSTQIQ